MSVVGMKEPLHPNNITNLLKRVPSAAKNHKMVVAVPFEVAPNKCKALLAHKGVHGLVVGNGEPKLAKRFPGRIGHWTRSDFSRWRLPDGDAEVLLFLGTMDHIGGAMLFEARRRGFSKLLYLDNKGDKFESRTINTALANRLANGTLNRFAKGIRNRLNGIRNSVTVDSLYKSARKGDAQKQLQVGMKAAQQGDAQAQFQLGIQYAVGNGVQQSFVMAYKWMNLAATQDYEDADRFIDSIASQMTPAQIAEAQQLAREWKPKK